MACLTWEQFERIVAQAFVNRGYAASLSSAGADGGVDVILKKDGKTWLVQAKHYQKSQVGAETVRSLYGVMQKYGAVGCYVITSGTFTGPARDFAKGLPIHLINGPALRNLIREGSTEAGGSLSLEREALDKAKPLCRECGHPMLIRTAKKGVNIGNRFMGCSDFPNCTYTEALD